MATREKIYLKDTVLWDSIDHEASKEHFPETYARLDTLTNGSGKKLVWWCDIGHSWESSVSNRTKGNGCPYCSGRLVTDNNRLSIRYPSVSLEWDREKNGTMTPEDVTFSSNRKFWWLCKSGHSWESPVNDRTKGHGCPKCARKFGKIEGRFIDAFTGQTDFTVTAHGIRLNQLTYASRKAGVEVDMLFFFNHHYLLVEYDGSYWHREKTDLDTEKSRALLSLGDNILHARIRENDLPNLDLAHDRFNQFRHAYHATESDSIECTVKEIERWSLEKIGA